MRILTSNIGMSYAMRLTGFSRGVDCGTQPFLSISVATMEELRGGGRAGCGIK